MKVSADQVSAATHAAADVIKPASVPPLRLPESPVARRPLTAWFAPLAAAAAVLVVVLGGTVAGSWFARSGSGHSSDPGGLAREASAGAFSGVPPYYVALGNPSLAVVRATATGATLVRITTQTPFAGVTGAASDRTFVLDAQRQIVGSTVTWPGQPTFTLLRLTASGAEASYTRLAIPALPKGMAVTGLALSPDGSKLAIAMGTGLFSHPELMEIMIYTVATGATRTWSGTGSSDSADPWGFTGSGTGGSQSISWTADSRTLAIDWARDQAIEGVRLLDTTASGDNLLTDSRLAVNLLFPGGPGPSGPPALAKDEISQCVTNDIITGDGSAVICGYATTIGERSPRSSEATTGFIRYSTTTGKVEGVSGVFHQAQNQASGGISLFWTNSTGSVLIGEGVTGVGVFSGGTFTPLPGIKGLNAAAW